MMATSDPASMMSPCEADDTIIINSSLLTPSSPSNGMHHTPQIMHSSFVPHMGPTMQPGYEPVINYSTTGSMVASFPMQKSMMYGFEPSYNGHNGSAQNFNLAQEPTIASLSQDYYEDSSFDYTMPPKFNSTSMYSNSQGSVSSLPLTDSTSSPFLSGGKDIYRLNMESTPELLNYPGSNSQSGDLFTNINEFVETGSFDSVLDYSSSTPTNNQRHHMKPQPLHDYASYERNNNSPNMSETNTPTFSDVSMVSILTASVPPTGSPLSDDSMLIPPKTLNRSSSFNQNRKISKKPSLSRLNSKRSLPQIGNHINHALYTPSSESNSRMSPLCTKFKGMAPKATTPQGTRTLYTNSPTTANGNFPTMCVFRHNSEGANIAYTPNETTTSKYKYDGLVVKLKSKGDKEMSPSDDSSYDRSLDSNESTAPVKKKYTRRRLLPRSKNGCWICRIKHLKCDETRPVCASCFKFGIECDYNPVKPDYVTDKNLRKQKLIDITTTRKKQASIRGGTKSKKSKSAN